MSPTEKVDFALFSVLKSDKSDDGEEVELCFSDEKFTFATSWLYLSKNNEGPPSSDEAFCKNPSKIRAHCVTVTGAGIKATVNITWNTGTTSQFPALWLRVMGPTRALEPERSEPRLPEPGGMSPRSGVGQLTLDQKSVRDRYRNLIIEMMKEYMEENWLLDAPTSLLREMLEYVQVALQRESLPAQVSAVEELGNIVSAFSSSSDENSLIDEETDEELVL